jgi:two-component system chemotaxis response regulator CheY
MVFSREACELAKVYSVDISETKNILVIMSKILIVDDSESVRLQLQADLKAAGFAVIAAASGAEGLEAYFTEPEISLVICDMIMPEMDGLTMCEKIRADSATIPLFMMTGGAAKTEALARARAINVGLWFFKPYIAASVIKAITDALAESKMK